MRSRVSGWGRFPAGETDLYRPERVRSLEAALRCAGTVVARGLGRSYGDASYNSRGATILMERLDRFLSFDPATGVLDCEAGVSFAALLDHFVPLGFFPPVMPGTKFVTLGGALACDIHGKNHHVDGSFTRHVLDFDLLDATGSLIRCSRTENADLFRATAGGLGLTGVVTRLRLTLQRIDTSYIQVDYERAANIADTLDRFEAGDAAYRYSVAWIDCLATGKSLGRSVLMRGNVASPAVTAAGGIRERLRGRTRQHWRVPVDAPAALLNRYTVGAFNSVYYRRAPARSRRVIHFEPFFFPLDGIGDWNRLYGRPGFVQYQLVLPEDAGRDGLLDALRYLSGAGAPACLAVLKRFGAVESPGLLSFPRPGYTLAVDLPWRPERTERLLRTLDDIVLAAGGRVYLAKDARLNRDAVERMYPELDAWRTIKRRIDPANRFRSDLARRLALVA